MKVLETVVETLKTVHNDLISSGIDYRLTGLTATNLYGYSITTNCIDIAVESDDMVEKAVHALDLPDDLLKECMDDFGMYVWQHDYPTPFWVRIQGDLMGEPFKHPTGVYLHSKELLLRRLEIYSLYSAAVLKACAFIALTLDDDKTAKYQYYWNRL